MIVHLKSISDTFQECNIVTSMTKMRKEEQTVESDQWHVFVNDMATALEESHTA